MTSTWRPIEAAPKDGTWVIVSGGYADENTLDELPENDLRRPVVAKWRTGDEYDEDGAWVFGFWDGAWRSTYIDPTHWQPIDE